jgi:thymidylate kinase
MPKPYAPFCIFAFCEEQQTVKSAIATPIFIVSGPPGSGKTTLCQALLKRFESAMHIPVDDLRQWVVSGFIDSVPWTDGSEQQFQIAEAATCALARTYADAGFAVAIDHCRNPKRMEQVAREHLTDHAVVKILLLPELEENLKRNAARTNKPFDPLELEETIRSTSVAYRDAIPEAWICIDNSAMTVEETVVEILRVEGL